MAGIRSLCAALALACTASCDARLSTDHADSVPACEAADCPHDESTETGSTSTTQSFSVDLALGGQLANGDQTARPRSYNQVSVLCVRTD